MCDSLKYYDNIFKRWKMHENWGKSFFLPMDKKMSSLILNGVLEKVLVCAQFSTKLANGTESLCILTQLFSFFGIL